MLIAISGAQGSGKSTLIKELQYFGYNIIERKTSRSILKDWGVTLQEVNANKMLSKRFQEEILSRKTTDDFHNEYDQTNIIVTERTPIDLAVYTIITFGNDNKYSDWLTDYNNRCIKTAQKYDHIFYIPSGQFDIEDDGVRGVNKYYSKVIDCSMKMFYQENIDPSKLTQIKATSVSDRIDVITKTFESFM